MGPQQILQLVQCRENILHGIGRTFYFTNSNLSFPCDLDLVVDHEQHASAKGIILHTISQASATSHKSNKNSKRLHAASLLESLPYNFVNCASTTAQPMLLGSTLTKRSNFFSQNAIKLTYIIGMGLIRI